MKMSKKKILKVMGIAALILLVIFIFLVVLIAQYVNENPIGSHIDRQRALESDIGEGKYVVFSYEDQNLTINSRVKNLKPELQALLSSYGYAYGNECYWDGDPAEDRSNLKCALNTALGLGYQCSGDQIALLEKYFDPEDLITSYGDSSDFLSHCGTMPAGSTRQSALAHLSLEL